MKKFAWVALSLCTISPVWAYQITINEPAEERAYHRPVQNIDVVTKVTPALPEGYSVAILLNDKVVADGNQASLETMNILAGEYTLKAIVMDKNAKTIAQDQRMIYVIQNAPYVRKKQVAIKEWQTYEALPWYKKLAIGLDPKVQAPPKVSKDTPIRQIQKLQ